MNTIYRKVPYTSEKTFDNEEERLESFICPLHNEQHQKFPVDRKTRRSRTLQRFGKEFLARPKQIRESDEEECQDLKNEEETPFNFFHFFSQMQQKPWFTVIPLGGMVRPEEVKVKLNPLCRLLVIKATPLMQRRNYLSRTSTKQINRIVTLPKNIRMEQLIVKLTPRGELVVMAPFKTQQGQETLTTPFFEQGRDLLSTLKWITIPIVNYRETIRNKKPFFPFRGVSESESSSSEESSTDEESVSESETSSSESETDNEEMMWPMRQQRETGITGIRNLQFQVQKYVQLLQKIFFPNVVMAKIVRGENTITTTTTEQLQVVLDVKFVDFRAEEIKVRMHDIKRRILIVEAKKVRQFQEPQFGTTLKFVRREFELPEWLDVKNIVYRVLPTGVLRIKLPLLLTRGTNFQQHEITTRHGLQQQQMGCPCFGYNFNVKRCPEYKKYQKKSARPYFF